MTQQPPVQQDLLSYLVSAWELSAEASAAPLDVLIDRLVLHIGHRSGVTITPGRVHALSTLRRRRPICLEPARVASATNRSAELESLREAAKARHVVDLHGPDGAGKSILAATLVRDLNSNLFPDGVVCVTGQLPYQDLLQALFDAFFESDVPVKITEQHALSYLANLRVFVLLDDIGLGPKQVDPVLDALREAAVLIVGPERTALGRGSALRLRGLARQDAVALFERILGRTPSADEPLIIDQICTLLNDMPLPISSVAAQAAQGNQALTKILSSLQARKPWAAPGCDLAVGPALEQVVSELDATDRQILVLLAVFSRSGASGDALRALAELSKAELQERVERLQALRIVQGAGTARRGLKSRAAARPAPRILLASAYCQTIRSWLVDDAAELAVANYYAARLERGEHLPGHELSNLLHTIEHCAQQGRLDQLRPLLQAADRTLAGLRWWSQWQHVLDLTRRAAQAKGDRALEAWAMHQLGSVLGALGVYERGIFLLRTALGLRQSVDDQAAALTTAHNLQVLEQLMPPPTVEPVQQLPKAAEGQAARAESPEAAPAQKSRALATVSAARKRHRRLRLGLLTASVVLLISLLLLRFLPGTGWNTRSQLQPAISWEFGDAWNALDNRTWTQQIRIVVEGGGADYRYFLNGEPVGAAFELILPLCTGAQGTVRVESGRGESAEAHFEFESPFCPHE